MNNLRDHLDLFPENCHDLIVRISDDQNFKLLAKKSRQSKLGDYRYPIKGQTPQITLNKDENKYRVLITYLHELAHHIVYIDSGVSRHPHGPKWKKRFSQLLDIFLQAGCFPHPLNEAIKTHLVNPKASSYADTNLVKALRYFDAEKDKIILADLSENQLFKLSNGRIFKKGEKRRTRILCEEVNSKRKYLIHSFAEVVTVE